MIVIYYTLLIVSETRCNVVDCFFLQEESALRLQKTVVSRVLSFYIKPIQEIKYNSISTNLSNRCMQLRKVIVVKIIH